MNSSNNPFNPFLGGNSSSSDGGGNDKTAKNALKPFHSANTYNPFRTSQSQNSIKNEKSQSFANFDQDQFQKNQNPWASSTWKPSSSHQSNDTPDPFTGITGYEMYNRGRPIEQQYKPSQISSSFVQEEDVDEKNKRDSTQKPMTCLEPIKKW